MKKVIVALAMLLMCALVFSLCCCTSSDSSDNDEGNDNKNDSVSLTTPEFETTPTKGIRYELDKTGRYYIVTGYEGNDRKVAISDKINSIPVTTIATDAFRNANITEIYLPEGITSIEANAFAGCVTLDRIHMPTTLKNIESLGEYPSVVSITNLENWFNLVLKCGNPTTGELYLNRKLIVDLVIPDSITTVNEHVLSGFRYTKSITIHENVSDISSWSFNACKSLTEITVDNDNKYYKSIGGNLYSKDGKTLIRYAGGKSGESFIIPDGVTSIGEAAFWGCDTLKGITIPSGVTSIGSLAFNGCDGLTSISISDSVTNIGSGAFQDCQALTSIKIPDGVTSIGSKAFYRCAGLTSIEIGNSVISIDDLAFKDCTSLENITVNDGNTKYRSEGNCLIEAETKTLILGCKNSIIPDDGSVTSIGAYTFSNCQGLTSIVVPDSVTSIGVYAFADCQGLTSIVVPNSITSVGKGAFEGCTSLESITIPFVGETKDGVKNTNFAYIFGITIPDSIKTVVITGGSSIGDNAFSKCENITSITLPDTLTSIGENAFSKCSGLTSITIPESVTSIGKEAFFGCEGFTSITIPESVESIGENVFKDCTNLQSVTLKADSLRCIRGTTCKTVTITSGTSIGIKALEGAESLESIIIPDSVTSIGEEAFAGCTGLTEITIPDSVTSIGKGAFSGCTNLESITLPFIGGGAVEEEKEHSHFGYVFGAQLVDHNKSNVPESLKTVIITGGTINLYHAFQNCNSITDLTLPDTVTQVSAKMFEGCTGLIQIENGVSYADKWVIDCDTSVTSVSLRSDTVGIGDEAFKDCQSLTNITIPASVKNIGDKAFYNCSSLEGVKIPNCVTSIGASAFYDCTSLATLTIGSSVTSIGESAFSNCKSLTSVVVPDSVISIGKGAFAGCAELESITLPFVGDSRKTESDIKQYPFGYIFGTLSYTGGTSAKQEYYDWSTTYTSYDTYYIPKNLRSVTITGGNILYGAFYNCKNLTSIKIPDGITSIGDKAFFFCTSLTSIEIPEGVTSIGNSAFDNCTSLTSIVIPDSVTSIGDYAFYKCTSLTSIEIPEGVTSIGNSAFYNCTGLTSIEIPEGVTSIGNSAFYNCTSLTSIEIPEGIKSIEKKAFEGCNNITSIVIPAGVTSIADDAFFGCKGIKTVYYTGSAEDWAAISISLGNSYLTKANIIYNYNLQE